MQDIEKELERFITESKLRRGHLDAVFSGESEDDQPAMKKMSFGGDVHFYDRKQVELNGDFSKEDLIFIASSME